MSLNQPLARMRSQKLIPGDAWRRLKGTRAARDRGVDSAERRNRKTRHKNEHHADSFTDCAQCKTLSTQVLT